MPRSDKRSVLFDDRSRYLDRFGLVLALTILAIVALALVDLSAPAGDLVAGIASVVTSINRRRHAAARDARLRPAAQVEGGRGRARRRGCWPSSSPIPPGICRWTLRCSQERTPGRSHCSSWRRWPRSRVARRPCKHLSVTTGTLFPLISTFLLLYIAFYYVFLAGAYSAGNAVLREGPADDVVHSLQPDHPAMAGYGDLADITGLARLVAHGFIDIGAGLPGDVRRPLVGPGS